MLAVDRRLRVARLILANLEKTLEVLSQRFQVDLGELREWAQSLGQVPRAETILAWGLENAQWKVARLPEDLPRLSKAATWLWSKSGDAKVRATLQAEYPDKNPKNLMAYTLHDVESVQEHFAPTKAQDLAFHLPEGSKLLGSHGDLRVVEVTTPEAACSLSSGSKWCTSDPEVAGNYLRRGPLYVIYRRGQKVAQFHRGTSQLMDLRDKPLAYEQAPEIYEFLQHEGLLAGTLQALSHPGWKPERAGFLKTLDNTTYGTPVSLFPDLHKDHFSHPEIRKLAGERPDWAMAYLNARNQVEPEVAHQPDPELERTIVGDPMFAQKYSLNHLKKPWPEGEPQILTDPFLASEYAHRHFGGKWPAADAAYSPGSSNHKLYQGQLEAYRETAQRRRDLRSQYPRDF